MSGVKPDRQLTAVARRAPGRAKWVAGTAAAAALLMFCYLRIAGVTQVNSDGAGLAWQAWDMLHGNVLLHGWWATDVAFYTTELPEYLVVTAGAGLRPEVVHICSAATYTLLVLLAAFVARGRARGAQGLVRALIAAVVILVPQPVGPTLVLLGNPDHVGTGVPVLVLLLLLDWAEGRRARPGDAGDAARRRGARALWWVPVAAGLLLAWSIIGDPLIEVVGAAPLFVAAALRAAAVARSRRSADPPAGAQGARARWSAAWYELSLAVAAVASVPVAAAGNWLITRLGGYSVANPWYHLQHLHEIVRGLPVAVEGVLALFGADYKVSGAGNVAFALVHLIGVAIVLAGFAVAAWGLVRPLARLARPGRPGAAVPGDLVADILVIAIAANIAAYLLEVPLVDLYTAHEIGPVLALGAALAGRVLGSRVLAGRGEEAPAVGGTLAATTGADGAAAEAVPAAAPGPARSGARRLLLPALAVTLACYTVMLGIAAAHKQAPPRNVGLTAWLLKHHLTSGFAPYWEASSITVDSGGQIRLLSVTDTGWHSHLAPQKWETNALLPGHMRPANFIILSPAEKVRRAAVTASFGPAARTLRYGAFTILVWPGNLLPQFERSRKGPGPKGD